MDNDARRWEELNALFHLAEEAPEEDREKLLQSLEPEMAGRLRALLRASKQGDSETQPGHPAQRPTHPQERIGPYTVIRRLGVGGFGAVYLVERIAGQARQRAALKIVAPQAAAPGFEERFYREQRILASLDHPNITRMLDAGLDEGGQPYLVMDYVDGQHLDVYCDERKLAIEDRVRLFLRICEAVDYAHRSLVVHLDLKPSNILVTADGTPKLLDFGTSKLLAADGQHTTTLSVTPSYASPEQLRNEAVTTACDIYSLGAILYELLAGARPAGESSMAAIVERAASEWEPPPVETSVNEDAAEKRRLTQSRLRALLAGDLSTIVRKCLSPRPRDRYDSVKALADDVARYLDGRPVLAQRQTTLYQLKKFVRRNQGKVGVSVVMAIALTVSLIYAGWRQAEAVREGQRAMRMQTFMYRLFKLANANYAGKPSPTIQEFLELGVRVLPAYIKDPADLRQAQLSLAESMYESNDYDAASRVYAQAIDSARKAGDAAGEAEALAYTSVMAYVGGHADHAMRQSAESLELSRHTGVPASVRVVAGEARAMILGDLQHPDETLDLSQQVVKDAVGGNLAPHEISGAYVQLGVAYLNLGRLDESERAYQEALRQENLDPMSSCDTKADLLYGLSGVRRYAYRMEDAAVLLREAYRISAACRGPQDQLAIDYAGYLAIALSAAGHGEEALAIVERDLPVLRKNPMASRVRVEVELRALAGANLALGRYAEAEKATRETIPFLKDLKLNSLKWGTLDLALAKELAGQNRYEEALAPAQDALRILSSATRVKYPLNIHQTEEARALLERIQAQLAHQGAS